MKGIPNTERQRLGALLDHETQETVMAMIPQFSETGTYTVFYLNKGPISQRVPINIVVCSRLYNLVLIIDTDYSS